MVLSMERWKGKVAVVTGASEGIGAVIVKDLIRHGVIVVGFARRKEKILALPVDDPKKLHAVKVDITKEQEIIDGFQWIKKNVGPIHILINNAGVLPNSDLSNGSTESWKKVLDTNVLGLSIATREALKSMEENGIAGHIIHINSIAGHKVAYFPRIGNYFASKFAVTALAETLRQELHAKGSKVKVTSVSPGFVKTDIIPNAGGQISELLSVIGDVTGLDSEDVSDAVIYALSTPPHAQVHEVTVVPMGQN